MVSENSRVSVPYVMSTSNESKYGAAPVKGGATGGAVCRERTYFETIQQNYKSITYNHVAAM